jgi:hypothetical protein
MQFSNHLIRINPARDMMLSYTRDETECISISSGFALTGNNLLPVREYSASVNCQKKA